MLRLDRRAVAWLNRLCRGRPLRLAALVAAKYVVAVPVAVVVGLGVAALRRKDAHGLARLGLGAAGTGAALAANQVVGHLYFRLRPYWAVAAVKAIGARNGDSSFYSDHTAVAVGLAVTALLASRRWGLVASAAALVVAVGRVGVGAHYPSDVVAGAVVGVAFVGLCLLARAPLEGLLARFLNRGDAAAAPMRSHERRAGAAALVVVAGLAGWAAAKYQDHGLRAALSRETGRLRGEPPSDARLYRQASIDEVAAGRWRSSRARLYGQVTYVNREPDGDVHVELRAPDHAFVVLEIAPEFPLAAPHDDDRITAWGFVRRDGLHNWWELHPVVGWRPGRLETPSVPGLED